MYGLIALVSLGLFLLMPGLTGTVGSGAVLLKDGEPVLRIPASQLAGSGEVTVEANGYHYHLAYEQGRIRFSEADCPDQVCVRTGWISRPGQIAACVPGQLILRLEGGSSTQPTGPDDVDVIVK